MADARRAPRDVVLVGRGIRGDFMQHLQQDDPLRR
jgi:hypothetical protein